MRAGSSVSWWWRCGSQSRLDKRNERMTKFKWEKDTFVSFFCCWKMAKKPYYLIWQFWTKWFLWQRIKNLFFLEVGQAPRPSIWKDFDRESHFLTKPEKAVYFMVYFGLTNKSLLSLSISPLISPFTPRSHTTRHIHKTNFRLDFSVLKSSVSLFSSRSHARIALTDSQIHRTSFFL